MQGVTRAERRVRRAAVDGVPHDRVAGAGEVSADLVARRPPRLDLEQGEPTRAGADPIARRHRTRPGHRAIHRDDAHAARAPLVGHHGCRHLPDRGQRAILHDGEVPLVQQLGGDRRPQSREGLRAPRRDHEARGLVVQAVHDPWLEPAEAHVQQVRVSAEQGVDEGPPLMGGARRRRLARGLVHDHQIVPLQHDDQTRAELGRGPCAVRDPHHDGGVRDERGPLAPPPPVDGDVACRAERGRRAARQRRDVVGDERVEAHSPLRLGDDEPDLRQNLPVRPAPTNGGAWGRVAGATTPP